MIKRNIALFLAAMACCSLVQARQIVDRTNKFYINLPDRYLLCENPQESNKYVVLDAYDPDDDSTFSIKISPVNVAEISGMALDNERSKFRASLQKMGLEPYVESLLHIAPNHESIYTFSRIEDNGEVYNYLIAKFWAHNKEFSFVCIQPTKTLRTQEFIDSVDSFICMQHNVNNLPPLQKKERPKYDKAKDEYDNLVKKTKLEAKKLEAEGKNEDAERLLAELPEFKTKPVEYIPIVEINGNKPLPQDILDPVAHTLLYAENTEEEKESILAKTNNNTDNDKITNTNGDKDGKIIFEGQNEDKNTTANKATEKTGHTTTKIPVKTTPPRTDDYQNNGIVHPKTKRSVQDVNTYEDIQKRSSVLKDANNSVVNVDPKADTSKATPPGSKRVTIIRHGQSSQGYVEDKPQRQLSKEEIKEMEKMLKEQKKFEEQQSKRQEKLDRLRRKELEKQRKQMEDELRRRE